jgi:peptidoglycan/xylan/chitin deacetylase (PgdA/CDA1 family)
MCVTPRHFDQHLKVLRQCAQPISLGELVNGLERRESLQRAIVITIDDGYADALSHAKPLLERYQIPATVFVTTGYLGREFWWDQLERTLYSPAMLPKRLHLELDEHLFEWVLSDADPSSRENGAGSSRQRLLQALYERLLPLSLEGRKKAMAQLGTWAGVALDGEPNLRALTPDELIELAAGDLLDIGAHTVTHPILADLPSAAQHFEIQDSRACLEELLGQPVSSFSYPNGSCSDETQAIVRDSGYSCACASSNGVAWHRSDPFHLPRFWIPDWDGDRFGHWLKTWL